jgi:hypothetical protein
MSSSTSIDLQKLERRYAKVMESFAPTSVSISPRTSKYESPHRPLSPLNAVVAASIVEPSLAAARQTTRELFAVTQRLGGIDDRLDRLERLINRAITRIDETSEKQAADARAVELLQIKVRELEQSVSTSNTRNQVVTDRVVAEVNSITRRLQEHEDSAKATAIDNKALRRALETVETSCSTLRAQREQLHNDMKQSMRLTEEKMEHYMEEKLAQSAERLSHGLKLMQQHLRRVQLGLNEDVTSRLDQFDKDRHEIAATLGAHATIHDQISDRINSLQSDLAAVGSDVRKDRLVVEKCEEDVKTLNRRMVSALRHLSIDSRFYDPADVGQGGTAGALGVLSATAGISNQSYQSRTANYHSDRTGEDPVGTQPPAITVTESTPLPGTRVQQLSMLGAAHHGRNVSPTSAHHNVSRGLPATSSPSRELDNFLVELDQMSRLEK